jgi:hypothetical protein
MPEPGAVPGLGPEVIRRERIKDLRVPHQLHRDRPTQQHVHNPPDLAYAPCGQAGLKLVTPVEHLT